MRPVEAWQDIVAGRSAGLRILGLEGAVPIEGGVPLVVDGRIAGAIGLSGGSAQQDHQCAVAGTDAITWPRGARGGPARLDRRTAAAVRSRSLARPAVPPAPGARARGRPQGALR